MTLSTDLPLPFPGWELEPTVAMEQGRQCVAQCSHCGAVLIVGTYAYVEDRPLPERADDLAKRPCPACCSTAGWWRQDTPVGDSLAGWTFVGTDVTQTTPSTIGAS